MRKKRLIL
jgi:hypothetical protein